VEVNTVAAATRSGGPMENSFLQGMPMAGGGRSGAGAAFTHKYGFKRSVLARPPSAG
jgi:hypothetical protein